MEILLCMIGAAILAVLAAIIMLIVKQRKLGRSVRRYRVGIVLLSVVELVLLIGLFGVIDFYLSMLNEIVYKPVIYLYPEEEISVSVELGYPERLTVSYPFYEDGWAVTAAPNGDLVALETGRGLYALYYESRSAYDFRMEADGFVVRGEDTAAFLEEKLSILGLTDHEAEEFIIYWLPILQENPYNYIRFAEAEEVESNMPLAIEPVPDALIRVLMTWKGLEKPVTVTEQLLTQTVREGFVAVEWGGTEIP